MQLTISEQPHSISKLPILGTIEWTVDELPFVCKGPTGGINGMGMIAYDEQVYVLGGHVPLGDVVSDCNSLRIPSPADSVSKFSWRYNPRHKKWERLQDMPQRREYVAVTSGEDKIYVLGGASYDSSGNYIPGSECFVLENCQNGCNWNTIISSMVPRTHASAGVIDGQLILAGGNKYNDKAGGYSASTIQNCVEALNLRNPNKGWRECSRVPGYGRGWAASCVYERCLYLFGGVTFLDDGSAVRLKEVLRYNPSKDMWIRLHDMPMAGSGWQADILNNRYILLAGGVIVEETDTPVTWNDRVFAYDIQNSQWFEFDGTLPPGGVFNNIGLSVIGDHIFVAGAEGPKTTGPKGDRFNYFLIGRIKLKP